MLLRLWGLLKIPDVNIDWIQLVPMGQPAWFASHSPIEDLRWRSTFVLRFFGVDIDIVVVDVGIAVD